jgi:hypothetical protein
MPIFIFARQATYSQQLGNPVSTVCLIFGPGFSLGGFISLVLALKNAHGDKK